MAQLVDIYGRPLKREALKTTQSVRVAERLRIYPDHPSRGLNIRKLPRILEAAEPQPKRKSAQSCKKLLMLSLVAKERQRLLLVC